MGRKAKYSPKQKVKACEDYLSGRKSAAQIARELGMTKCGDGKIMEWSRMYKTHGASAFEETHSNRSYSRQFKEMVARE